MDNNTLLPRTGTTLADARTTLSGLHFAKESLSQGERNILYIAEALLRVIDETPMPEQAELSAEAKAAIWDECTDAHSHYAGKQGVALVHPANPYRADATADPGQAPSTGNEDSLSDDQIAALRDPDHPLRPLLLILDDYDDLSARNYRWAQNQEPNTTHHSVLYAEGTTFDIAAKMLRTGLNRTLNNLTDTPHAEPTDTTTDDYPLAHGTTYEYTGVPGQQTDHTHNTRILGTLIRITGVTQTGNLRYETGHTRDANPHFPGNHDEIPINTALTLIQQGIWTRTN